MVAAVVVCHGAHHECDAVQIVTLLLNAGANVNKAKKREQPRAESRVNAETGEGGWASGGGGGNKGPLGPACGRGWLHNGRGGTAYVRVRQAVL